MVSQRNAFHVLRSFVSTLEAIKAFTHEAEQSVLSLKFVLLKTTTKLLLRGTKLCFLTPIAFLVLFIDSSVKRRNPKFPFQNDPKDREHVASHS